MQAALLQHPHISAHPTSKVVRLLYECSSLELPNGLAPVRLLIASHPASEEPPKVGKQHDGLVYELFLSTVPAPALNAQDLLDLYLHRGAFETELADEDQEQDADRWSLRTNPPRRAAALWVAGSMAAKPRKRGFFGSGMVVRSFRSWSWMATRFGVCRNSITKMRQAYKQVSGVMQWGRSTQLYNYRR